MQTIISSHRIIRSLMVGMFIAVIWLSVGIILQLYIQIEYGAWRISDKYPVWIWPVYVSILFIIYSFLVTFLIIDFSPFLLTKIQPDSTDYLNFHPKRQTTYYILIQILEFLKIDLIFFQKLFLRPFLSIL